MSILTTPRLRLEPYTDAHLEGLHLINSNEEVMRYITGKPVSYEETKAHIELTKELWRINGYASWCFIEKMTNQIIGTGGIQHLEFNQENPLEIGWRILPSKWHQGFATEAAQCMMKYAFDARGLEILYSVCHPDNIGSEKIMRRLDMTFRGIEKWYDLDTKAYQITKEQYQKNQPKHDATLKMTAVSN